MTGPDPDEFAASVARENEAIAAVKDDRSWGAHMALAENYLRRLAVEAGIPVPADRGGAIPVVPPRPLN